MSREAVLSELATRLEAARRIAVDGPDAAGKTTLADELAPEPVVVDGVFLQRPELDDLWDVRIWVEVSAAETVRRASVRDAGLFAEVRLRYERRYLPGQRLYAAEVDPKGRAQIVLDNEDPQQPRLCTPVTERT